MRGKGGSETFRCGECRELLEDAGQHRLDRRKDVVLRDERQLDVQLIELSGRPIGAGVFVSKARGDLEVAVEAGHHQQLLELLRRLGQRVKLPGMDAARHEVIARALGGARRQNRRLKLQEALLLHAPPDAGNHARAEHDVRVDLFAAQIQKPVAKTLLFRDLVGARDLERQRFCRRQYLDLVDHDLDVAGREGGIDVLLRAGDDPASDADHALEPDPFGDLECAGFGHEDALRHAVVVAQIDEQQLPMVPLAIHPSGKANGPADVLGRQRGAGVSAIRIGRRLGHYGRLVRTYCAASPRATVCCSPLCRSLSDTFPCARSSSPRMATQGMFLADAYLNCLPSLSASG